MSSQCGTHCTLHISYQFTRFFSIIWYLLREIFRHIAIYRFRLVFVANLRENQKPFIASHYNNNTTDKGWEINKLLVAYEYSYSIEHRAYSIAYRANVKIYKLYRCVVKYPEWAIRLVFIFIIILFALCVVWSIWLNKRNPIFIFGPKFQFVDWGMRIFSFFEIGEKHVFHLFKVFAFYWMINCCTMTFVMLAPYA